MPPDLLPEAPDFDFDDGLRLETNAMPDPRAIRRAGRAQMVAMLKREELAAVMPNPPEPGFTYHLISNGKTDFWCWVPVMVGWCGTASELFCSTWTLNRTTCTELFAMMDAGKIVRASFLTGLYFKRRETSVYATLLEGLHARGQRFIAFENHAKILLLKSADGRRHIVVEGSANLTSNPRVEQNVISDDTELYAFHREWMEEMLSHARTE